MEWHYLVRGRCDVKGNKDLSVQDTTEDKDGYDKGDGPYRTNKREGPFVIEWTVHGRDFFNDTLSKRLDVRAQSMWEQSQTNGGVSAMTLIN